MSSTFLNVKAKQDIDKFVRQMNKLTPAQTFGDDESVIRNTVQLLVKELSQPPGQKSLVPPVSLERLEEMIRSGYLNLIAECLPNSFFTDVEEMLQKSSISFSYPDHGDITLKALFKDTQNKKEKLGTIDHLIKIYTQDGPFYRKMNAILCNYNDEATTTLDEKKVALLMNIILAKASIEKRKNELQQVPDVLYRGQNYFPKAEILEKLNTVQEKAGTTGLLTQSIDTLRSLDVSSYFAAKRFVSTSTNIRQAMNFASVGEEPGAVWHIHNLESVTFGIADVDNISSIKGEKEFTFRLPDDVIIMPVSSRIDEEGITHIEVECVRMPKLNAEESRYNKLFADALKKNG